MRIPRTRRAWLILLLILLSIAAVTAISSVWLLLDRDTTETDEQQITVAAELRRGQYLVRIGNCISCHTRKGGEPFAGGVPFSAPYAALGTLYSTNITPDPQTGIGRWTEKQFIRAMREGAAPKRGRLFPAFPYTYFTRLNDADTQAIFAFLRTLEPVRYTPPDNSFTFTQRWGMALWNGLYFKSERFEPDTARSADWNRGAYLVNGLGHCGACHTPRNALLSEKRAAALSGNTYSEPVSTERTMTWFAVNLTSAASGLGSWSVDDIQKYLKTGHSRRAGIFGPMNEVVINSLQYLTDEDAHAMAVYLKSLPPLNESPKFDIDAARLQSGAEIYVEHCEKCHRSSGRGAFLKAPPIAGSAVAQGRDPATLINVILYGAKVGVGSPATLGTWEDMPGFAEKLTDEQVAAVGTYVRGSWNNRGGVVTAQHVRRRRAEE